MEHKFRDGIQAIVYRMRDGEREFLILHRIKNWVGWEFPKGGIKGNETHKQALLRELAEECSIREDEILEIWPTDTNLKINYPEEMLEKAKYRGASYKIFLVELSQSSRVAIENNDELEHDAIKWILENEADGYLDQKLLKSMNESTKILKS